MADPAWFVYMLESVRGELYTGVSTNVERRLKEHNSGKGAKFTRGRGPWRLLRAMPADDRSEALSIEARLKQLSKSEKREWASRSGST